MFRRVNHLVRLRRPRPRCSTCQNCTRRMTKIWNTSQTSLQHSMASEVTCLLFVAVHRVLGDEPSKFISRPPALQRSASFRDCGGYSRWRRQLDGCRGSRAALRRVEFPGQGGGRTRAALRRVGFSAQELDSCSVRLRSCFPRCSGAAGAFQMNT